MAAIALKHGFTKDQVCILPRMPLKSQGEHPDNPVSLITGAPAGLRPVNIKSILLSKNRQSFGYSIWTKLNMVVWLGAEFKNSQKSFQQSAVSFCHAFASSP